MRFLALLALVSSALTISACGGGSSADDAGRLGKEVVRGGDQAIDDIGRQGSEVVSQELDRLALESADASTVRLSEDTGISANESREISCALLKSYEEEGSVKPFASWAIGQLRVPPARRYQVEEGLEGLEEAIGEAEAGNGLDALVSGACAF